MKKQMVKIELGTITERNRLSTPKMEIYTIDDMTEKQLMLYIACREGDGTLIRDYLRENDLYTNIIDIENRRTLIHYTAEKNLALSTNLLITKLKSEGFEDLKNVLNIQDIHGNTPLHLALLNGKCKKLIRILVENGSSIYIRNNNNESVLQLAQRSDNADIRDYFSRLDANLMYKIPLMKQSTLDRFLINRTYLERRRKPCIKQTKIDRFFARKPRKDNSESKHIFK